MPAKSIARSLPGVPDRAPTPARGTDHRAPWRTRRTRRPPRVGRVREIFPFLPENRKKSGMVLFFSMIPIGCAVAPRAGQRPRRSGRPPRPRPNLPKEREIFSNGDQPGLAGVPDFGKTENRNHGRWRGRAGGVVVGAVLWDGVSLVQHAEKN